MQPIFKEQIQMWKDKGYDIPIQEGMYWLDNGIIKAFTYWCGKPTPLGVGWIAI